jgi:hypothetical protein
MQEANLSKLSVLEMTALMPLAAAKEDPMKSP